MTETVDVDTTVVDTEVDDDASATKGFLGVGGAFLGISMLIGLAAGVAAFSVRLPYLALQPGNTFETEEYVVVEGTESYTSPGEVSFVTVTQRRLTPFSWLTAKLADSDDIFHEDELLRGRTFDEQREENAQLMLTSQNAAIAAALGQLGFETAEPAGVVVIDIVEGGPLDGVLARNDVITEVDGIAVAEFGDLYDYLGTRIDTSIELVAGRPGEAPETVTVELTRDTAGFLGVGAGNDPTGTDRGAYLGEIVEGGAVDGLLQVGDRIVSFDGTSIASFDELVPALVDYRAGDEVVVDVLREDADGAEQVVSVEVALGVRVLDRAGLSNVATQFRDAELPIDVSFTTEDIGGPSAGLAFTLTVLDVLTEGDLTGGVDVVVTGTIDRAGNVGPIGGVKQKAFAARDADAAVFLVPAQNLDEARAAVDDLRIEPVATLADALEIIADFGGNADELPSAGEL